MSKQLNLPQRYAFSALEKRGVSIKECAAEIGCHRSTLYRERKRNATKTGRYNPDKAQEMANERKERIVTNSSLKPGVLNEALRLLREEQWSPRQISGYLKTKGMRISAERIYQEIRTDETGELAGYTRHGMKYRHHIKQPRPTKATNIPDRVSIHERPVEADGTRFGDWEMDLIIGKNGKGAILVLMERSTNFILMLKLEQGKKPKFVSKAVYRLLLPYIRYVLTITTDNGSEFADHKTISKLLKTQVYFADSYCSWQKGGVENANKLIRQYIPKGSDFDDFSDHKIMEIQKKINRRPREKLNFRSPKDVFFDFITNFAFAS